MKCCNRVRNLQLKFSMKQIIFYAPLGKGVPVERIGGAEAGCIKTKQIYEHAGIQVIPLDKPAISRGKMRFMVEMLILPIKLFCLLFKHPKAVLHIVGFYTKIAKYEWLLVRMGMCMGHKVIYELRNGSMIRTYENGTKGYRKTLEHLLLKPDVVLCQGMEYVDFINEKWGVKRSYYPNFIMNDFLSENHSDKKCPVRFVYFGRVTESKNVDVIIRALALVRKAGIDAVLEIIGGYNEKYKSLLDSIVREEELSDYVVFYGRQPFGLIAERLRCSHYFVFPSEEKQEGHSNSLTEAMGCGVVPIVSDAGFNESICGIPELVIRTIDARIFADKIIDIERRNLWKYYSELVYQRVEENYTQEIVSKKLIKYVEPLFES